ncbi:MAG: restriction endonuclease subunit R [Deltaproteobacteria bacterium]|nr:MAG: restriction endonuclease subunit R [Deltaproteobacteria bacterium]
MIIQLSHHICLPDVPEPVASHLKRMLTLQNPKWVDNNRQGRSNRGVPRDLTFYAPAPEGICMPRGFMRELINTCRMFDLSFEIKDHRRSFPDIDLTFNGTLKPFQQTACDAILKKDFGVLTAPTGAGKTVMQLYLISRRRQPTLIIVHTKDLARQWIDRIETFLSIPAAAVGMIGDGHNRIGDQVTVAMVQSLYKRVDEVVPRIGYVVVDECHRAPSRTFTEAVTPFDAKYMTGLSATPWRRDRLSKLIFWHLGDAVHEVDKKHLIKQGDILKAEICFRQTDFQSDIDGSLYYTKLMKVLTQDQQRNIMIAADVAHAAEAESGNGTCLVLSDRKIHCETIRALLKYRHGVDAELLTGDLKATERKAVMDKLNNGAVKVLIATSQLIGEGFDSNRLTTLFLIYPVKFSGRLIQYLGRILRPGPGKTHARVYDYVDIHVGVLEAAAKSRHTVYQQTGSLLPEKDLWGLMV